MTEILIKLKFQEMDDYGDWAPAESANDFYEITVNNKKPARKQIETMYHEFTHLIIDMFFGKLYLNKQEEDICRDVEKVVMPIINKATKSTIQKK